MRVAAEEGFPPGKLHAYVKTLEVGAQAFTVATGEILALPQKLAGNVAIDTVGGFFTITVCVEVAVPQEFVVVRVIVYVPGWIKLKEALAVVWFGIGVVDVPQ